MGEIKILLEVLIKKPKNLISIARDRWRFIVLLTIPTAVVCLHVLVLAVVGVPTLVVLFLILLLLARL